MSMISRSDLFGASIAFFLAIPAAYAGTPFCDGNSTVYPLYPAAIPCPCGTPSPTDLGCLNIANLNAQLKQQGSDSVTAADAELDTVDMPPNKLAFTYFGQTLAGGANPIGLGYGNGIRCINSSYRLPTLNSGALGAINYKLFVSAPAGTFVSGQTWLFQTYYRDNTVSGCSTNYENMSNAWSILFTP